MPAYDVLRSLVASRCVLEVDSGLVIFFFQAEDGIRDRSPSRGLGDVYKRQMLQYRIKRYQAMGNGAMCQTLNGKLQKLLSQQVAM